jgi:hypothetical protein
MGVCCKGIYCEPRGTGSTPRCTNELFQHLVLLKVFVRDTPSAMCFCPSPLSLAMSGLVRNTPIGDVRDTSLAMSKLYVIHHGRHASTHYLLISNDWELYVTTVSGVHHVITPFLAGVVKCSLE